MFSKICKIIKEKSNKIISSVSEIRKQRISQRKFVKPGKHEFNLKKISYGNLELETKLTVSFAALIILFIFPISVSLLKFNETVKLLNEINSVTISEVNTASSVSVNLKEIEKNLYASALTDNITKKEDYAQASENIHNVLISELQNLKSLLPEDINLIDKVLAMLKKESAIRYEIMNSKYKSDATRIIFNSYEPVINDINSSLNIITENINVSVQEKAVESLQTVKFSLLMTVSAAFSALMLGIIISKVITKSFSDPINQIEGLAMALSEGNLSYEITYESKNELGRLAENLRKSTNSLTSYINEIDAVMNQLSEGRLDIKSDSKFNGDFNKIELSISKSFNMLSETLEDINRLSSEVSERSSHLMKNSQNISKGAADQSSSIEESYAAIEEISDYVKANTENTYDAKNKLIIIDSEIAICSAIMNEMVGAMSEISIKSREIEKIIKVIDNITFQTNILALNAAVEAAHAGTAGKGFAVVADEVKNLASNSSEAAKNIALLIEETRKAVLKGDELANKTASSLSRVIVSANDATDKVKEISKASEEQSAAIEQIKAGIQHVSNVVQANSSAAEQSYYESRELFSSSQSLYSLVNKFVF
ncbi:MAG: HAMP domain-containing methyl-accepting chemotaxis protein [Sedimentibacter sp.]|uniref:methyl-accepting chemotaxis protein n=1 Tax=Sedimentibacter sp. TaxID=1960295 RepID=UPI0031596B60